MSEATLVIDSSNNYLSVALIINGKLISKDIQKISKNLTEILFERIDSVLSVKKKLSDLKKIFVCVGPGNFTGIRTGLSAAKGLSFGLGIELVGFSLFQALAIKENRCMVIFNNKLGRFLIQEFVNGKEISKVNEISEDSIRQRVGNYAYQVIGFQLGENFQSLDNCIETDVLKIENISLLTESLEDQNNYKLIPYYFSPPRISVSKK